MRKKIAIPGRLAAVLDLLGGVGTNLLAGEVAASMDAVASLRLRPTKQAVLDLPGGVGTCLVGKGGRHGGFRIGRVANRPCR